MNAEPGAQLRAARKRAGLTLSELAREVGLSPATLSRAETGQGQLTPERLRLCAVAMGVELESLPSMATEGAPLSNGGGKDAVTGLYVPGVPGGWRHYEPLTLTPALQAALESFLQYGYHGSSVREVAALAELSVPGLYHHYSSKHDLLVAIMDLTMDDFVARCVAARDEGATPVERFTFLVECFALFHSHRHELAFIGASEMRSLQGADRARIVGMRNACQQMIDEEVRALVADGGARTTLGDDAARAVVTMLVGIANWYRRGGALTPEEIARRYVIHATGVVQLDSTRENA